MASPHVAAAAILLDLATGKTLTPAQLESKVRSATTNNGSWQDEYKGCGFLDMSKAELPGGGTPTPNPTVVGYRYSAQSFSMEVGDRETVKVYAKFSDGTEKDVTASSKLYSTNPSVADVSTDGTVTAKAAGKAQLTMAAAPDAVGIPAPVQVTVSDSVERPTPDDPDQNDAIVRYEWECVQQLVLHVGDEMDIRLFAVHSSGKRDDVTSKARLYTLDESIARVENGSPAVLTALAVGDTKMAFEFAGVAGGVEIPAPIAVHVKAEIPAPAPEPDPDTFVRLYWSFSNAGDTASGITLSRGRSLQVDIMGETTDGRTVKLTQECQPYTSDTGVATISETGRLTAVGSGTTTLWLRSIPNVNLELPPLLEISVP